MCGRFSQNLGRHKRAIIFFRNIVKRDLIHPGRYNIAPTQYVPIVAQEDGAEPDVRELYWGLIPFWAKDMSIGVRSINARGESVDEKPTFRDAFKKRRCLVPASGFYEWKQGPDKKTKTPYYFTGSEEEEPLVFAGLWERWDKAGEEVQSFTIITTEANGLMAPIHNRMPVILQPDQWEAWLDPENKDRNSLKAMLQPAAEGLLKYWEVGPYVNNPRHEGEQCIEKVA